MRCCTFPAARPLALLFIIAGTENIMQPDSPIIYEEHCSVLADWWSRGLQDQTLLYFDAHLDLQYISDERIERLSRAENVADFRGMEKPSHLLPDGRYVYGLENFLYPASRLGIVNHLIWVAPPHVDIGQSKQVYHYLQQMDGLTLADIGRIGPGANGGYEAEILGLHITLCRLEDLPALELPVSPLVDIDTDYFVALPEDQAWLDPSAVFETLRETGIRPPMISIARSVSSGFMPLRYRYFANYLKAMWDDDREASIHYGTLFRIGRALENGLKEDSEGLLDSLLNKRPWCAATRHYAELVHAAVRGEHLGSAGLDTAYRHDPVRIANELTNRHLPVQPRTVDKLLADYRAAGDDEPVEGYISMGLAYARAGHPTKAIECYRAYGRPHPSLALEIGQLLLHSTHAALAFELLQTATAEDSSYSLANFLIGQLHLSQSHAVRARPFLERAHARAPAWIEPVLLLLNACEALGDNSGTAHYRALCLKHHRTMQAWQST
jgi:hypothetical protein